MKVLVACPTAESKDYALGAWADMFWGFRKRSSHSVSGAMVDTTGDDGTYYARLEEYWRPMGVYEEPDVRVYRCPPVRPTMLVRTITKAWETIIVCALAIDVDWIFSLEIDITVPEDALDKLVDIAETCQAGVVSHDYPYKGRVARVHSLGCTLINPRMFSVGEKLYGPEIPNFEDNIFLLSREQRRAVIKVDTLFEVEHNETDKEHHVC